MAIAFRTSATSTGSTGAAATPSLAGASTGDLMILFAVCGGLTIANPSGWNQIDAQQIGSSTGFYIGWRVKQAGDTVSIGGGGITTTIAHASFYSGGAAYSELATVASGTGSSTTIDPNALTINDAGSMSIVASGSGGAQLSTPSTNWNERQDVANAVCANLSDRGPGLSAGSLDPGNVTFAAAVTNRLAYHIEIVDPSFVANTGGTMALMGV